MKIASFRENPLRNPNISVYVEQAVKLIKIMTIILVMDNDCAIGKNNALLCSLPADMKRFREVTKNSAVIMGRRTYESFPKRPLPDRENIVLSRSVKSLEGAVVFDNIEKLLKYVNTLEKKIFVIGGGDMYAQLEQYCEEALITRVYENFDGDVFFKDIEHDPNWRLAESSPIIQTGGRNIRFFRFLRNEAD